MNNTPQIDRTAVLHAELDKKIREYLAKLDSGNLDPAPIKAAALQLLEMIGEAAKQEVQIRYVRKFGEKQFYDLIGTILKVPKAGRPPRENLDFQAPPLGTQHVQGNAPENQPQPENF